MKRLVSAICLLVILSVGAVGVLRMNYPFELEWMEGASLQQVERLQQGKALYVEPGLEFTPLIYTPLYFVLAAPLSAMPGSDFLPLRLLSFVAWLVSLALIFLLVFRHTASRFWSLLGAATYAACFEIGGAWFDIARADSLCLAFLMAAWLLLEHACRSTPEAAWRYDLGAALFLLLAFLSKQSALLVALPFALHTILSRRGASRYLFPLAALGGIGAAVGLLAAVTDGWFTYYVFELASGHAFQWHVLGDFWRFELLRPLPFVIFIWLLALWYRAHHESKADFVWLLVLSAAFLLPPWFSRLHSGSFVNVLLPAYAFLAVQYARTLWEFLERYPGDARESRLRSSAVMGLCLLQFVLLAFDPRDHLPNAADRAAGEALLSELRAVDGDAWLPSHPWMAGAAGGESTAHEMALLDVLRSGETPEKTRLDAELRRELSRGRWELVILDHPWYSEELALHYRRDRRAIGDPDSFWPVTGLRTRPEWIYERSAGP